MTWREHAVSEYKIWDTETFFQENSFDYVEYMVDSWKVWINKTISELDELDSSTIKILTYFSIMDMLSQEYFNYPDKQLQKYFCDFILEFQDKYKFLELVDPITLYYHLGESNKFAQNIGALESNKNFSPQDKEIRQLYEDIKNGLEIDEKDFSKLAKKHRYVDLLYRMRCRVTHEFSDAHIIKNSQIRKPYYTKCCREYMTQTGIRNDKVWQLIFPVGFVKDLCVNCFENYLKYCIDNHIPPGRNNGMDRLCELTWYSE